MRAAALVRSAVHLLSDCDVMAFRSFIFEFMWPARGSASKQLSSRRQLHERERARAHAHVIGIICCACCFVRDARPRRIATTP
jgi:predicted NUDIX family NTP pyrophosphohydrolase